MLRVHRHHQFVLSAAALLAVVRIAEPYTYSICSQLSPTTLDSALGKIATIRSPTINETLGSTEECSLKFIISRHWYPRVIFHLKVTSFDLGGEDPCSETQEHLSIRFAPTIPEYRGAVDTIRWCGQSYARDFVTSQDLELVYYPGPEALRGKGFTIELSTGDNVFCPKAREVTVSSDPVYLYSPNYPGHYYSSTFFIVCSWELVSKWNGLLMLDTLRFSVKGGDYCGSDCLEINGDKFGGDKRVQLTASNDRFLVSLRPGYGIRPNDAFVIKVVEVVDVADSCDKQTKVRNFPVLLHPPPLQSGRVNCWWSLNTASDDHVVFLETKRFNTTASCSDFELKVYDGDSRQSRQILSHSGCSGPMFQAVRSSSRHLFIDIVTFGSEDATMDVEFTASSSLIDAPPRVLYASLAPSYVWLDLDTDQDISLLLRSDRENYKDYSSCLRLSVKQNSEDPQPLSISDFLYAYSGWNETFAELGSACGQPSRGEVLSYGSKVYISRGKSAARANPSQIWLIYSLQYNCTPETIQLQASSVPQMIRSDSTDINGTISYPNNNYCRWMIGPQEESMFTQVKFTQLQLFNESSCFDNITVYDYNVSDQKQTRLTQWCTSGTPTFFSMKGNSLLLEFATNFEGTTNGFQMEYSTSSDISQCPAFATIVAREESQDISSKNYPGNYANNLDCMWRIVSPQGAINLTVQHLSLDTDRNNCSQHDYVVIYDGPDTSSPVLVNLCENADYSQPFISSNSSVLVHFHTNEKDSSSGFLLTYRFTLDPALWKCNFSNSNVQTGRQATITSPFYPNPIPAHANCFWLLKALEEKILVLEVDALDLSCATGSVALHDGSSEGSPLLARLCGLHQRAQYKSKQRQMYIVFKTHANTTGLLTEKGFKLNVRAADPPGACAGGVGRLFANSTKQYLTTPSYPAVKPENLSCHWRIESSDKNKMVHLQVEDAKVGMASADPDSCSYDSIDIYDGFNASSPRLGRYCGNLSKSWYSRGAYLYIHFQSGGNNLHTSASYQPFRLSYRSVSELPSAAPNPESEGESSSGLVIGLVVAGCALLLLGVVIFLCWRRSRGQAHSSSSPPPPAFYAAAGDKPSDQPPAVSQAREMSPLIHPPDSSSHDAPPPYPESPAAKQGAPVA